MLLLLVPALQRSNAAATINPIHSSSPSTPSPNITPSCHPARRENWCYHRATLYSFAKHFETGEPLPEATFERLKAAKNFRSGTMTLRQVRGERERESDSGDGKTKQLC